MKQIFLIVCGLVLMSSSQAIAKGDVAAGKAKAATCVACHGQGGNSVNPLWPNLCGQKDQYVVKQLKAFKSGERKDPLMAPMAKPLTEADMENLAAYFSKEKCK